MKLRRLPEDFQVEELTRRAPDKGAFAFYRLTKNSIGTPEAVSAISDRLKIPRRRISYGGLKDRHAVTIQYLTIHQGPRSGFRHKSFNLEYLGQTSAAFTPADIDGNRFQLVLRDMTQSESADSLAAIDQIRTSGLPNYFDNQRFGSLGVSGDWIAKSWCQGDYERALWLALADPYQYDHADERRQKEIMREHWGRWPECKQALSRSHRRSIVTFLSDKVESGRHPDYRGAFARISVDLRGLYLSAWQSALWNRLLTRFIKHIAGHEACREFPLISGPAVFIAGTSSSLPPDLAKVQLILPSARIDRPEGIVGELLDRVLAEEGIELRQIRVKYPRDSFFSKGSRQAIIFPDELTAHSHPDELYPQRRKLVTRFCLPRGSYATILVKRITSGCSDPPELDDEE
ncbi:MAG: tRNA pseudouridine(13) synthase TruD [Planctomyces sp.]|nr:tRNA pseudouridine(13) synthase TruD [Planctomyces sp.]